MTNLRCSNSGSQWHKWDLHFHTQSSPCYLNGAITNAQIIKGLKEHGISVVAITDHNHIDKKRITELRDLSEGNIVILPGIEIRTAATTGKSNIHLIGIFEENADVEAINNKFDHCDKGFYQQKQEGKSEEQLYIDFNTAVQIIHSFNGVVTIHVGAKKSSIDEIKNSSTINETIKEDLIKEIDILETNNLRDVKNYREKVLPNIGDYPMIICSDNHDITKYNPETYLWIKADTTLEGLKQAMCSHTSRIQLLSNGTEPEQPLYYISNLESKIPENIGITLVDNTQDDFCFSGWNNKLYFNKGLNCIIGDRGTGKSVLLDLIGFKLNTPGMDERSKNKECIISKLSKNSPETFLEIERNTEDIEYYTQNGIECIARNKEITDIVMSRIVSAELTDLENRITHKLKLYNDLSTKIMQQKQNADRLVALNTELQNIESILSSISDNVYIQLRNDLSQTVQMLIDIQNEKKEYQQFIYSLLRAVHESTFNKNGNYESYQAKSGYGQFYFQIFQGLKELLSQHVVANQTTYIPKPIPEAEQIISDKQREQIQQEQKLKEYLQSKGIKDPENLNDRVIQEKNKLEKQNLVNILKENNSLLSKEIDNIKNNELREINDDIINYKKIIDVAFSELRTRIQNIGDKESATIDFKLSFDFERANSDFIVWIDNRMRELGISERRLEAELKMRLIKNGVIVPPKTNSSNVSYLAECGYDETSNDNYKSLGCLALYLAEYWDEFINKYEEIYNDIVKYKLVHVLYKGKDIKDCSFGQRATATIIVLLSLGNNPIIIDEPESNLGESVIYNELTQILKIVKNKRQIIFATHNANIVINGDADQIIHLDHKSSPSVFTIENVYHRSKLYALEGGQKAFADRQKRYAK